MKKYSLYFLLFFLASFCLSAEISAQAPPIKQGQPQAQVNPAVQEEIKKIGALIARGESWEAVQARLSGLVKNPNNQNMDINALVQAMMKEAQAEAESERKKQEIRLETANKKKQEISKELTNAQSAAKPAPKASVRRDNVTIESGAQQPEAARTMSKKELDDYITKLEEKQNVSGKDVQMANADLQNAFQKQQQLLQAMSSISKTLFETAMAVVGSMDQSPPPLTLSAPESLILGTNGKLSVTGGQGLFTVTVSGNQLMTTKVSDREYTLTPTAPGKTVITVKDGKGTIKQHTVTVTPMPLKIEMPSATMVIGKPITFDIKGGIWPYTVTMSIPIAQIIPSVSTPLYTRFTLAASAVGTVIITAHDRTGATANATLTIQPPGQQLPLKLSVPSNRLNLGAADPASRLLSIQGGTPPYSVSVSGNQLRLYQVSANQYQMVPQARGQVTIVVRDSRGATAGQPIIIQ